MLRVGRSAVYEAHCIYALVVKVGALVLGPAGGDVRDVVDQLLDRWGLNANRFKIPSGTCTRGRGRSEHCTFSS